MNQFVQRLANYLANEVIVKGLAESKIFQRFALRSHNTYNDLKKQGTEQLNSTLDDVVNNVNKEQIISKNSSSGPPKPPLRGISGFFVAFGKEIGKDLGFFVK